MNPYSWARAKINLFFILTCLWLYIEVYMTIVISTYFVLKNNLGIDYKMGNYLKESW